eukprot:CAMPEP_0184010168 /NCGR_PEP_ID=MMETSP0954-20121128/3050_1 /TAXON_ID=627963 /ORGANISM="Aplanochytrium sp, Strain PBS07" /LENGTH=713 /DNA_ID=CAMNT_0026289701 /DNA_START=890 /DNA_END=3031 /DNA_ORIENTATION=-
MSTHAGASGRVSASLDDKKNDNNEKNDSAKPTVLADLAGEAIVGTPVQEEKNVFEKEARKKKREKRISEQERLLAREENKSLTPMKAIKLAVHYFFVVDGYVERFVKGTARVMFTILTRPWMVFVWTRNGWKAFVEELRHYWAGFKLLGEETKTSYRLLKRKLQGHTLTRRERRQLLRTSADLLRVIPVSIFLIVPFMEFLLPVAVKIFPNLLPSTFQSKNADEEKNRNLMKLRIEYVGFFQEMSEEMARRAAKKSRKEDTEDPLTVEEIEGFFEQLRMGRSVSENNLYRIAKVFDDDNFLDNMSRAQLVLVCRYMGISPYGGNQFLRFQLHNKISSLRDDDRQIYWEGINSLDANELEMACQERGMRATGLSIYQLRKQLTQWLELSVNKKVSTSLLILSRAYALDAPFKDVDSNSIGEAIGGLDPEMTRVALTEAVETLKTEGVIEADPKTVTEMKLEAIKKQNAIIASESASQKKKKEKPKKSATTDLSLEDSEIVLTDEEKKITLGVGKAMEDVAQVLKSASEEIDDEQKAERIDRAAEELSQDINVEEALEALKVMSAGSSIEDEKKELEDIVEKLEAMEGSKAVNVGRIRSKKKDDVASEEEKSTGDRTQAALQKRISRMLEEIQDDVDSYDRTFGKSLEVLDLDKDGLVSCEELRIVLKEHLAEDFDESEINKIVETLDLDRDGIVSIEELTEILERQVQIREKAL